jgi:hypothetical protein
MRLLKHRQQRKSMENLVKESDDKGMKVDRLHRHKVNTGVDLPKSIKPDRNGEQLEGVLGIEWDGGLRNN